MNKNELLEYIIDFIIENNWDTDKVPEQCRAFFTTWCFIFRVDADTKECDDTLITLYWRAVLEELIEYDEFERFMVELIM